MIMKEGGTRQSQISHEEDYWGPIDCLLFNLGGIMEAMELVSQPQHGVAVVLDHAKEVLETEFFHGHWTITHGCNHGLKGYNI